MKTKSLIFILVSLIVFPVFTYGQAGLLKKALNKQLNHKIDSAATKNEKNNEQNQQAASQEKMGTKETGRGLFGGKIDIKFNDEYQFTGRIYMQMESYDKKDVVKSDFYTYFNTDNGNAEIEIKTVTTKEGEKSLPSQFIFDAENKCFLMIIGNGTGIISTLPSDSAIAAQAKPKKAATITKTGNSKVIAGYKCDEYKVVEADKDGYSNVWMTKDVKLKANKKYWGKAGVPTYYGYSEFEGSMMLAMEGFDKKGNPTLKTETIEINPSFSNSVSTKGITFMKMNFNQAGKK